MSNSDVTSMKMIRVYSDLQAMKSDTSLQAGDIVETLA